MKKKRIVLIGSTRNQYLKRAVTELKNRGSDLFLLAKEERINQLCDEVECAGSFHGNITWHNLSLLCAIRRFHPDIVAFAVGNQFHHENVSQALRFWKRIGALPGAEIYASLSHDPASLEYWGENPNARLPASHAATREGDDDTLEQWRRLCLPVVTEDPTCGWRQGRVDISAWVTEPDGTICSWELKTNSVGARRTGTKEAGNDQGKQIALFGGDKTFGLGLSDEETFAWRLQELVPSVKIHNYGVEGYDIDQIALSLPRIMSGEKADLAIVELSAEAWDAGDRSSDALQKIITCFTKPDRPMIFVCFGDPPKQAIDMVESRSITLLRFPVDYAMGSAGQAAYQESVASSIARAIEAKGASPSIRLNGEAPSGPVWNEEKAVSARREPIAGSSQDRFHLINFVWGDDYIRLFLDVTLPNHCTEGNLYAFSDQCDAIYKVYTRSCDAEVIRSHPLFAQIRRRMPTEVIALDHFFTAGGEQLDNALLVMTQMHRVAVKAAYRDDARLVILPSDQVYSEGAFLRVIEHARKGSRAVVCTGIRVVEESFVPAFKERFQLEDGAIPVPARELVRLAIGHIHPIAKALFYDADPFSTGPHILYHYLGDEVYVTHNLHLHVLMIYPRKPVPLKEGNFDTSWLAAACPCIDDYYIVDDSDEIMAIEISEEAKSVGLGGKGPIDPVRLGAFYKDSGTPIHWQFLKRPIFIHTGNLNEKWRRKAREVTAFVQAALPLKERLLRWFHLLFTCW